MDTSGPATTFIETSKNVSSRKLAQGFQLNEFNHFLIGPIYTIHMDNNVMWLVISQQYILMKHLSCLLIRLYSLGDLVTFVINDIVWKLIVK